MFQLLQKLQQLAVLGFLLSSMLGVGLSLGLSAIVVALRDLRLVVVAIVLNFILAPAFAWALTVVIPLDRGHAIGLLLLGGSAGAPFLPKVVQIARGDPALAASLMGLLTLGTILFLPFALPLMIPGLEADPWKVARPLILLIVLPLVVGMIVKRCASRFAECAAPVFSALANGSLLLLSILLIALNAPALLGVIGSGAILAALVYFAALFGLGWLLGGPKPETRAILALATTARNFGAALVPAASSFSDPKVTIMIIVGAIVCLILSFLAARWVRSPSLGSPPASAE
jgi:BASS family bile acid:Na+ symporter